MRTVKRLLAVVLAVILCFCMEVPTVHAEGGITVDFEVRYGQTEARAMLAMVNDFRTGNDAWAWNQSNTEKVRYEGLGELVYDYELERAAMQRAAEIALSFSHGRPNGTMCFTAVTGSYRSMGENIAYGYSTASGTFAQWQENGDDYAGQGHRRNMLSSDYNRIGIGHVVYEGIHYWVQELGYSEASTTATAANNSSAKVSIEVASDQIVSRSVQSSATAINAAVGQELALPRVTGRLLLQSTSPYYARNISVDYTWTIQDTSVVSISNGVLKAHKVGATTMTTTAWGQTITIPVTVAEELPPDVRGGEWKQDRAGWWYRYGDGSYAANCWERIGGEWYYFNASGYMATGWKLVNGTWYYLEPSGAMATGWKLVNGTWYYLEPSGAMATGWRLVNGTWYYLESSGAMATGWKLVNGTWYYLEPGGAMATGWKLVNGTWYYLEPSGAMATGWKLVNGTWYYLYDSGAMAVNTYIGTYYVNASGAWIR